MSSEEVRLEIVDSEPDRGYWNLRDGEDYNYRSRTGNRDSSGEKENQEKNNLRIDFDLAETREMTEEQKQMVLNTLADNKSRDKQSDSENSSDRERGFQPPSIFSSNNTVALIALLAFLVFMSLLVIGFRGGGCFY